MMALSNEIGISIVADGVAATARDLAKLSEAMKSMGPAATGAERAAETLNNVGAAASRAEKSVGAGGNAWKQFAADFAHVGQSLLMVKGAVAGVGGAVASISSGMTEAAAASQKLSATLGYSSGSAAGAAREMDYLVGVTRRLGLDFATASTAYAKFSAATKDSGVSAAATKNVFEGVAKAAASLGLSADETNGALLALSQMASKGTVNAEELRGQLAERLPGAFNIAAKAMGVTTAELGKMMEKGELAASDFLPRFGEALNKAFTAPAQSISAEMNRMASALELFKREFSSGTKGDGMSWLTRGLNEATASMKALGDSAGIAHKLLVALGGFQFGALNSGSFDLQTVQEQKTRELARLNGVTKSFKDAGYPNPMQYKVDRDVDRLRGELLDIAMQRGKQAGFQAPDLAGDMAAQRARQAEKLKSYLDDTANAPKAVKIAKEVEDENKKFSAATIGMDKASAEYVAAVGAHNQRVAEIRKKGVESGKGAYQTLSASLAEKIAVERTALESTATLSEGEKLAARYRSDLASGTLKLTETQKRATETKLTQLIALEKENAARKAAIDGLRKQADGEESQAKRQVESNDKLRDEIATLGLGAEALADYNAVKIEAAAATLEQNAALIEQQSMMAAVAGDYPEITEQTLRLAEAQRASAAAMSEQAALVREKAAKQVAVDQAKASAEAWKNFSRDIEQSLTDSLMRSFDKGESFGKSFVKSLQNYFRTAALKLAVQATVTPVMNSLGQVLGFTTAAGGQGGAASSSGGALNLLSTGQSAYNLYNGNTVANLTGLWNDYAAGTSIGGYTLGSIGAAGAGVSGSVGTGSLAYGSAAGWSGGAGISGSVGTGSLAYGSGAATGGSVGVGAGSSAAAGSSASAGALSSAASTAGWFAVGYAIGTALFGSGKSKVTGSGTQGALNYNGFSSLADYADMKRSGGLLGGGKSWTNTYAVDQERASAYARAVFDLRTPYQSLERMAGGDGNLLDQRGADWSFGFKRSITSAADFTALMQDASDSLGKTLMPELVKFQKEGERLAATAARMVNTVQLTTTVAEILGKDAKAAFSAVGVASLEARQSLVDVAGGLDALKGSTDAYYTAYFSEAEKHERTTKNLTASFATLNLIMPATKDGFRKLVEGMDLTSLSGQQAFVTLMNLAPAFAEWSAAAESGMATLNDRFRDEKQKQSAALADLTKTFSGIGLAMPQTKAEFLSLVESLDATTYAGRQTRETLLASADAFAAYIDGIENQISSLQSQRLSIAGNVVNERDGIIDRILGSLGKDASLRARDLEKVDPLNRDMALFAYAIDGAAEAAGKLADAQQALSSAQVAAAARLQNAGSGIASLVAELRSGTASATVYSGAQAAYATDLSAARAGDAAASERISASARVWLEQIRANASSQTEVDIAMTRLASELEALPATKSWQQQQAEALAALATNLDKASAAQIAATEKLNKSLSETLLTGFTTFDSSLDGLLSFEELQVALAGIATDDQIRALIGRVDANGDGQISRLELVKASIDASSAQQAQMIGVLSSGFAAIDASNDGLLTFDEMRAALSGIATDDQIRALIATVDANGDGQISRLEAVKAATRATDGNTADLIDGSDAQISEMRRMVAETIVNSGRMMELNASILALTNEVATTNEAKKQEAALGGAQLQLEAYVKQQEGLKTGVTSAIQDIWALAAKYGLRLEDGAGKQASFGVSADGLFQAVYNAIIDTTGTGGGFSPFKSEFYAAGGVYDRTYGMADDLEAMKAKIEAARQAVRDLGGIPKFETGGSFAGGLRLVGERGPELEVTGPARIFNFDQTRALLAGQGGNAELITEVRALRRENELLRAEVRAVAQHTYKSARRLEQVVGDGVIVRTEAGYPLEVAA